MTPDLVARFPNMSPKGRRLMHFKIVRAALATDNPPPSHEQARNLRFNMLGRAMVDNLTQQINRIARASGE